ncbi:MAG: EamA family transporter [Raoultibacter sp.]
MGASKFKTFLSLHFFLMLYSVTEVLGKSASAYPLSDPRFFLLYGSILLILVVYALGWQQVIKHLPLTTAFANKAVTVFWGIIWGALFFQEAVTPLKLAGVALIIAGVLLFSRSDVGEVASDES